MPDLPYLEGRDVDRRAHQFQVQKTDQRLDDSPGLGGDRVCDLQRKRRDKKMAEREYDVAATAL